MAEVGAGVRVAQHVGLEVLQGAGLEPAEAAAEGVGALVEPEVAAQIADATEDLAAVPAGVAGDRAQLGPHVDVLAHDLLQLRLRQLGMTGRDVILHSTLAGSGQVTLGALERLRVNVLFLPVFKQVRAARGLKIAKRTL